MLFSLLLIHYLSKLAESQEAEDSSSQLGISGALLVPIIEYLSPSILIFSIGPLATMTVSAGNSFVPGGAGPVDLKNLSVSNFMFATCHAV